MNPSWIFIMSGYHSYQGFSCKIGPEGDGRKKGLFFMENKEQGKEAESGWTQMVKGKDEGSESQIMVADARKWGSVKGRMWNSRQKL